MNKKFDMEGICNLFEQHNQLFVVYKSDNMNMFAIQIINNANLHMVSFNDVLYFYESHNNDTCYLSLLEFFEKLSPEAKKVFMFNIDLFR